MRSRRQAREAALSVLYQVEVGDTPAGPAFEQHVQESGISHELADYAERIIRGVIEQWEALDEKIASSVKDYDYDRLAAIDRNILRVAAYELLFMPEIPPAVLINEAIEISKIYSTAESGRFINGVLGRMLADSPKASWDPKTAPSEEIIRREPPIIEEETVQAESEEAKNVERFGWVIRQEGDEVGSAESEQ